MKAIYSHKFFMLKACAGQDPFSRALCMRKTFQGLTRKSITFLGIAFAAFATNGCDSLYWNEEQTLNRIGPSKEITVLTVNRPLVYSTNQTGEKFGVDHDLIQAFAKEYGFKVKFQVYEDETKALTDLQAGKGDLLAARLRQFNDEKDYDLLLGPAYEETHLSLACHRTLNIQNLKDLDSLKVAAASKDLTEENYLRFTHLAPTTKFEVMDSSPSTRQLLRDLNKGNFDCIIAENKALDFNIRYFSKIEKITHLTGNYHLHWFFHPKNKDLAQLSHIWFRKASRNDSISEIRHRYLALLSEVNDRDVRNFVKRMQDTLPLYKDLFIDAAEEHQVPWQLAAAVAYQESHWNPDARSFTGVRGIMQLTEETAAHLGVEDRSDAEQSIWGGTKYLRILIAKFPKHLPSKDRLSLALAAYNIGWAHLEDAQKLAVSKGLSPHSWIDLKKVLPLLEDPAIAKNLKYGKARGNETVAFVDRVKGFYSLIILNSH